MKNNICVKLNLKEFSKIETLFGSELVYEKDNISVAVLGNVYSLDGKRIDAQKVYELYKENSSEVNTYLNGVYTAMIFDFNVKKAYVFQDYMGFNQAIYYYNDNGVLYITNSLKAIVRNVNRRWEYNLKNVDTFIKVGFCPNSGTLIDGINKIHGKHALYISGGSVKLKKIKRVKAKKERVTEEDYFNVVKKQCIDCAHADSQGSTISSGYDSNFILYNLTQNLDMNIDTFCIGGTIGRNEVPDSKEICDYYDNVTFHSKLVNGSSFSMLPEIIYVLEGAVYEGGIFLQYELAKLVAASGCKNIMLGDCADQVLNFQMYHPVYEARDRFKYTWKMLPGRIFKGLHFRPFRDVYSMASYIVSKKNGIMMNYFDVNPEYVYLRKDIYRVAENSIKIGERQKEFHKKVIHNKLPKEVLDHIKKVPGATELKELFIGEVTFEEVEAFCKKSEFYKEKKFADKFYGIDNLVKIVYLEVFRKMFLENKEKYLTDEFGGFDITEILPSLKGANK